MLIGLGVLFLLVQYNLLTADRAWAFFWPCILIFVGVRLLGEARKIWVGGVLIAIGVVLAGSPLGYWNFNWDKLWPVVLILVGVAMLVQRGHGNAIPEPDPGGHAARSPATGLAGTRVDGAAVFGGFQRRITDQDFSGGDLLALFGGFQLDLTRAALAAQVVSIEVVAVFGGGEIRVPDTWIIDLQGAGILGAFTDETHQQIPAAGARRLVVRGIAGFGGVVVKN